MTKIDADMKRRLALACCQGIRQQKYVEEALSGDPVRIVAKQLGYSSINISLGTSNLGMASFKNLKSRLQTVGFEFKQDRQKQTITMTFPEENKCRASVY